MARTDAHRPSAINPEEYDYVACDYYGEYSGIICEGERKLFRATGGKYAVKYNSGTCHICGAAALYVAKFHHRSSNTYIVTGEDCAFKMEGGVFKRLRTEIAHERKITKGKAVAREMLALLGMSDAWRVYETGYDMNEVNQRKAEEIIISIVAKLIKYGSMSEKQAALIVKLLNDISNRATVAAQRVAENAKSDYIGTIGERIDFNLTVIFIATYEGSFGTVHVYNMKSGDNVIVYKGNVLYTGNKLVTKGDTVMLKATVKAHSVYRNIKQTVISRPKVAG